MGLVAVAIVAKKPLVEAIGDEDEQVSLGDLLHHQNDLEPMKKKNQN